MIKMSDFMGKLARWAGVLLLGVAGVVGGVIYSTHHEEVPKGVLRTAPTWILKDQAGNAHRLEELKGKVVILHFWASWCPPCLDEIPQWLEMSRRFKNQPVVFVAVSLDSQWKDALKILPASSLASNVLSVLDESGKVPEDYGTYQFPETYLLNSNLEILTKWIGPQDWKSAGIEKWMGLALSQKD